MLLLLLLFSSMLDLLSIAERLSLTFFLLVLLSPTLLSMLALLLALLLLVDLVYV